VAYQVQLPEFTVYKHIFKIFAIITREKTVMYKKVWLCAVLALVLLFSGCALFLPSGEPPEGAIVQNDIPEKLSREQIVLSLGSRIAGSAMQSFPGAPVALETDKHATLLGRDALREAGHIAGVRHGIVAAAVLTGKCVKPGVFEFELFHFNRSLWRCSYELKK
jgi:hypothetical protein